MKENETKMHRQEEKKREEIKMDKREKKKITLRKKMTNYEENQELTRLIKKTKINKTKANNFFYKERVKHKKQENNES